MKQPRRNKYRNSKLKQAWADMKQRCNNPKVKAYEYYGKRGITYHEDWEQFPNFEEWALESGFSEELSLDRIDVNGNYKPSNCRWVTREIQDNNRTNSVFSVVNGEKLTLKQIADKYNFPYSTIQHRYGVGDRGDSLIEPLRPGKRRDRKPIISPKKFNDKKIEEVKWLINNTDLTQKEIGDLYGMSQTYISKIKLEEYCENIKGAKPEWYKEDTNTMLNKPLSTG